MADWTLDGIATALGLRQEDAEREPISSRAELSDAVQNLSTSLAKAESKDQADEALGEFRTLIGVADFDALAKDTDSGTVEEDSMSDTATDKKIEEIEATLTKTGERIDELTETLTGKLDELAKNIGAGDDGTSEDGPTLEALNTRLEEIAGGISEQNEKLETFSKELDELAEGQASEDDGGQTPVKKSTDPLAGLLD